MTVQSTIETKLTEALSPLHLEVINESGNHSVPRWLGKPLQGGARRDRVRGPASDRASSPRQRRARGRTGKFDSRARAAHLHRSRVARTFRRRADVAAVSRRIARGMNVATFYRFVRVDRSRVARGDAAPVVRRIRTARHDSARARRHQRDVGRNDAALGGFVERLQRDARFAELRVRRSRGDADNPVFFRMKVRVRRELIAMRPRRRGSDHANRRARRRGTVESSARRSGRDRRSMRAIDYEIELGTFPGAVDPGTRSFREFPRFADTLDPRGTRRLRCSAPAASAAKKRARICSSAASRRSINSTAASSSISTSAGAE